MKQFFRQLGPLLLTLHLWGIVVAAPIFNWKYAHEHGFMDWMLFGQVVPTAKALIWPYYAFSSAIQSSEKVSRLSKDEEESLKHMGLSLQASQAATLLINSAAAANNGLITKSTVDEATRLRSIALGESRQVQNEVLEKLLPEMSKQWRELYERSLEIGIDSLDENDAKKREESIRLANAWLDWFEPRRKKLLTRTR